MFVRFAVLLAVLAPLGGVSSGEVIEYKFGDPNTYRLTEVNQAGGIQVGDKLFSDFTVDCSDTVGVVPQGLYEIKVRGVDVDGDYGLIFIGGWSAFSGQTCDSVITFKVTAAEGYFIKDNGLKLLGCDAEEGGSIIITENIFPGDPKTTQWIKRELVYCQTFSDGTELVKQEDHEVFTPLPEIWVVKDVYVTGGIETGGVAHLSQFQQTFSQVPEPATLSLLALGGLAILRFRRHRHRA
jgi:hypothetical protein